MYRGDLAVTDQPRLYFLPSPWTHFLAPALGQRKKQQSPKGRATNRKGHREKHRQKKTETGRAERMERRKTRKKNKKRKAAGLSIGIKTGANPFLLCSLPFFLLAL